MKLLRNDNGSLTAMVLEECHFNTKYCRLRSVFYHINQETCIRNLHVSVLLRVISLACRSEAILANENVLKGTDHDHSTIWCKCNDNSFYFTAYVCRLVYNQSRRTVGYSISKLITYSVVEVCLPATI